MDLRDRLRLEHPVLQAGMGGGLAGARLAAAVSAAGALGTLGTMPAEQLVPQVRRVRERAPGRPVAVNLLVPFLRPAHVRACIAAGVDAVVLFFGYAPRAVTALRAAGVLVVHQVGGPAEAARAVADGADVLVAQGLEAGGHLRADRPLREALPAVLAVAGGRPVLAAGGIADAAGTRAALDAGAAGVVAGTRFLLTQECSAHPEYQRRVLGAPTTLHTQLFGLGWPGRHRVVPNAATQRWCARHEAGPPWVRALNRGTAPVGRRLPLRLLGTLTQLQRPGLPLLGPGAPLRGMPDRTVDATALYAGASARHITSVVPAAEAVRLLVGDGAGPG